MNKNIVYTLIYLIPILFLTSCLEEREPIKATHFEELMAYKGYTVLDVTYQINGDHLNLILLAISPSETYQFEFYKFISDEEARFFYQNMRYTFETNRDNPFIQNSFSIGNLDRFQLTSGGVYIHLLRIGNTVLLSEASEKYRDLVRETIDSLEN